MQLSIVIVNYNVRDLLLNAVASLRVALEGIEGEIIVVDNASSDGAMEALNRKFPEVITIPLEKNLGFGAANNIGIERSRGKHILLINPDTIVEEKTLHTMIDFMEQHPDAAFAGCKVILPDGSFDAAAKRGFPSPWSSFCKVFGLSKVFPKSRLFGGYNLTYLDPESQAKVEAICGCFMFCDGDRLRQLGGFDTDFFMYGEDLDLCFRARQMGWEIYYYPATTIVHLKGESTRRSSIDALAVFYEAMEIFARKHFRANSLLLLLVRIGIRLRRTLARVGERLPNWPFMAVDAVATLAGFLIGSYIKNGDALDYPSWALTTVLLMPPLVFVLSIAIAGGYGSDDRSLRNTFLGYLFGFFVVNTLQFFFKEYGFSRGVPLAITGLGMAAGLVTRFAWILYKRAFGSQAIRRIAFLSRQTIDLEQRNIVRNMFLGRPVTIVGAIAPTFSELDELRETALGTVENIAKIVRELALTDVVVLDRKLNYGEVLRAMNLTANQSVRFHIASGSVEGASMRATTSGIGFASDRSRRKRFRFVKRLTDRLIAVCILLFIAPVVYLAGRGSALRGRLLLEAVLGKRPLVFGGPSREVMTRDAVFTVVELCQEEALSPHEIAQIDDYYIVNQSLLLDCEIILAILGRRTARQVHRRPVPVTGE